MANKTLPIFDISDVTASPEYTERISSLNSISLQIYWADLVGSASLLLSVSNDDTNFDDYPVVDPLTGNRVISIPISGSSGSVTIQIDKIISKYLKIKIDGTAASSGDVSGVFIIVDIQDTY